MTEFSDAEELDLKALDEALRASAKAAGWKEDDFYAEGILPEEIQKHPSGPFVDFELDQLPEGLRWLGWADWDLEADAIIVYAKAPDIAPVVLGTWPRYLFEEWYRRNLKAEGVI